MVALDLRKGYTTLRAGLPGLFEGETATMLEKEMPPASEVPDTTIDVSFWVRDGHLTRTELDPPQFLDKPAGHLVLRAEPGGDGYTTAPSDAVDFDLKRRRRCRYGVRRCPGRGAAGRGSGR